MGSGAGGFVCGSLSRIFYSPNRGLRNRIGTFLFGLPQCLRPSLVPVTGTSAGGPEACLDSCRLADHEQLLLILTR